MSLEIKCSIAIIAIISSITAGCIYKMHVDYTNLHDKINNIELKIDRKLTSIEESINAHKILLYKEDDIKEDVVAINGENQVKKEEEKEYECELLDECYDSIPLNNVKKNISFKSWLFK